MPQRTLEEQVQWLVDRTEISDVVTRYFTALDHRDWEAVRATLAPTIALDFEELFGDPPAELDSDDFVGFARSVLTGFTATQHISPNHIVEVEGDRATCRAYMYAWHTAPTARHLADELLLRGHYVCGMVRTAAGWRMDALHMTVWDEAGDKGIYAVAQARMASETALAGS